PPPAPPSRRRATPPASEPRSTTRPIPIPRSQGRAMSTTTKPTAGTTAQHVDLAISGMTCASCSARVERKLNKLDGVEASVNLATERASVSFPSALSVADIVATVEKTGYGATPLEKDRGDRAPAMTHDVVSRDSLRT